MEDTLRSGLLSVVLPSYNEEALSLIHISPA